ncbi:hypothetical protein N7456_003348 [Penicillium angulare]|uniref:Calcineurin-like phosphoesterase domain-containing protein n=1 Tax=Penicillium angulare TaxID=116970 RepID=A0A9W9FUM2_9EURO|nr:hypothetical protein N7456_003348 [Penicillium angulare]
MLRKTRFVCVSDTHDYTPMEAGFKLPAGDVLIHAGDLTNKGSLTELRRTMDWISNADFEIKIIVAGNHDVSLDSEFYAKHGQEFHSSYLEDPVTCLETVTNAAPSVIYLQHQAAVINLTRENGPNTTFKVFGSPYSQFEGNWAFGYNNGKDASALWDQIPIDSDIIVTHTPPYSHCDQKPTGRNHGCDALRQTLSRIRPQLALCGHVHEGRGYERVCWQSRTLDGADEDVESNDITRGVLPPPGSKKQALVDLTGKREKRLDNNGYSALSQPSTLNPETRASMTPSLSLKSAVKEILNQAPALSAASHEHGYNTSTSTSDRADDPALQLQMQTLRRETCIVNSAILATSWPHQGGKRFNTPIVIDLELPVREDDHASQSRFE